jgi:hypothetical protein
VSLGSTPEAAEESLRKDMPIYADVVDMAGVRKK